MKRQRLSEDLSRTRLLKNGMDQVQILTPYRKRSAAGLDEIEQISGGFCKIRPIAGNKELHIGSQVFRVGDKILQIKIPRWRVTAIWAGYWTVSRMRMEMPGQ